MEEAKGQERGTQEDMGTENQQKQSIYENAAIKLCLVCYFSLN